MGSGSEFKGFDPLDFGIYGAAVIKENLSSFINIIFCDITRVFKINKFSDFFHERYLIWTSMGFNIHYIVDIDENSSDVVWIDFRKKEYKVEKEITIREFKNILINHINEKFFSVNQQFGSPVL